MNSTPSSNVQVFSSIMPITYSKNLKTNSIDARDLHTALQVKNHFKDWIKDRLDDTMSIENVDFFDAGKRAGGNKGKLSNKIVIIITLGLAKEIAMLERNEAGKKVRKYFIQCEEELRTKVQRAEGDHYALMNEAVNYMLKEKRKNLEGESTQHFHFANFAKAINKASFGYHENGMRDNMTLEESKLLGKNLLSTLKQINEGVTRLHELELEPKLLD